MTTLIPAPTRWYEYWLYLGSLYTHAEMLERFDYAGGDWHERSTH